jgi:septum formation protein
MSQVKLLLASGSPRRRELLRLLNLPFEVSNTNIDETQIPGEKAEDLVGRLSRLKAETARVQFPDFIVIAADTDVELDGVILGKPRDQKDARIMLRALRGRDHIVYGGMTISFPVVPQRDSFYSNPNEVSGNKGPAIPSNGMASESRDVRGRIDSKNQDVGKVTLVVQTRVWMRNYSDSEIEAYVATGDPLDKAAAYAVQHHLFRPVARVEGCFANVMGLALCRLWNALAETCSLPAPCLVCHLHPGEDCTVPGLVAEGVIAGS